MKDSEWISFQRMLREDIENRVLEHAIHDSSLGEAVCIAHRLASRNDMERNHQA
jgi:hypothetical protein